VSNKIRIFKFKGPPASQPASQPTSQPASQPASQRQRQPASLKTALRLPPFNVSLSKHCSLSHCVCWGGCQLAKQPGGQPASQPASQPGGQPASQSASAAPRAMQLRKQPARQPASQTQPVRQPARQPDSQVQIRASREFELLPSSVRSDPLQANVSPRLEFTRGSFGVQLGMAFCGIKHRADSSSCRRMPSAGECCGAAPDEGADALNPIKYAKMCQATRQSGSQTASQAASQVASQPTNQAGSQS
jgi:hypothetical protein